MNDELERTCKEVVVDYVNVPGGTLEIHENITHKSHALSEHSNLDLQKECYSLLLDVLNPSTEQDAKVAMLGPCIWDVLGLTLSQDTDYLD
jgi:regulator of sigma D